MIEFVYVVLAASSCIVIYFLCPQYEECDDAEYIDEIEELEYPLEKLDIILPLSHKTDEVEPFKEINKLYKIEKKLSESAKKAKLASGRIRFYEYVLRGGTENFNIDQDLLSSIKRDSPKWSMYNNLKKKEHDLRFYSGMMVENYIR